MSSDLNDLPQDDGGSRGFGSFVLLIGLAFAVLLVVYVYVGRLSGSAPWSQPIADQGSAVADGAADGHSPDGGDGGGAPAQAGEPGTSAAVPSGAGELFAPATVSARPGPLPTQPDEDARIETYSDPRSAFRMALLDCWSAAVMAATDGGLASAAAGYDVVFVEDGAGGGASGGASGGERLAVSVRPDGESLPLERWAETLAPGLSPVDGRAGANATIAGMPAMILWRDESPTVPAAYVAVLTHDGRAYAVSYSASGGGSMIQEFVRALVTFEVTEDDSEDTIPPIPQPAMRYFPASVLPGGDLGASTADQP